jgi:hypothetical protein
MTSLPMSLTREDYLSLKLAHTHLETPSFAVRLSNVIGTPIEMGLKLMPRGIYQSLQRAAEKGVWRALNAATSGLQHKRGPARDVRYKIAGIAGGAVGGFFGGPAILLELPLTSLVMLRAIADIARAEGEQLDSLETRMACLEVFALGGRSADDDAADLGYYGLRLALEAPIAGATRYIAQNGVVSRAGSPLLVDLIATVSRRFGATVSERAAAKIIPVIGSVGGAFINHVFIQHFQDMARGHFTIRRLERKYGPRLIRSQYDRLSKANAPVLAFPVAA